MQCNQQEDLRGAGRVTKALPDMLAMCSLTKMYQDKFGDLTAAVRGLREAHALPGKLESLVAVAGADMERLSNLSPSAAKEAALHTPDAVLEAHNLQAMVGGALDRLEELEAAVAALGDVKAALQAVQAAGRQWGALAVSHQHRWHNENCSKGQLLRLPPSVLRDVARRVGKDMRLVCTQVYHTYGSPGTGLELPKPNDVAPEGAPAFYAPLYKALRRWQCPWEVQSLRGSLEALPPAGFRLLMSTFTSLHNAYGVPFNNEQQLQLLPGTLASINVTLKRGVPQPLQGICHLTALRSLCLHCNQLHAADLQQPLQALLCLTELRMYSTAQGPLNLELAEAGIWGPISRLPDLQSLHLNFPWSSVAPLPADMAPMLSLKNVILTGEGGGIAQEAVHQVFKLFPQGIELGLENFASAFLEQGTHSRYLNQALDTVRCSKLDVCMGHGAFVDSDTVVTSLSSAIPHLVEFSLKLEESAGPGAVAIFSQLLHTPLPLHALQKLHLSSRDPCDPVVVLNTIAPSLPNLSFLELHTVGHPASAVQPAFGSSLQKLAALHLNGFSVVAALVPYLTALGGLAHLVLQIGTTCDYEPWASTDVVCLPASCTTLTALTHLQSLAVTTAKIAQQPGESPAAVGDTVCWFPLLLQMRGLRELQVFCCHRVTPEELVQLQQVAPRLQLIQMLGNDEHWVPAVEQALGTHVELDLNPWA